MDKAFQTMSPKTVRSHQEHWCWKKYFALFNIFHQIILKQFSKVGAIPIIQIGKLRHTLTMQFSQYYIACQRSTACTHTLLVLRGPMESTSSLVKAFYLLNMTQQIHLNYVTGGRVGAPMCLHIVLITPSHQWENKHFIHTILTQNKPPSRAPEWRREEAATLSFS